MTQDPQLADKVISALKELAGAAGTAAEKLWPMAVRATWAQGVSTLLCCMVISAVAAVIACFTIRYGSRSEWKGDAGVSAIMISVICGIVACFAMTVGIYNGLPAILAPEGNTIFRVLGR